MQWDICAIRELENGKKYFVVAVNDKLLQNKRQLYNEVNNWQTEKVVSWVSEQLPWTDLGLKDIPQIFYKEDIDGKVLLNLNDEDLILLGINDKQIRTSLMNRIWYLSRR